ncbi:Retrotransposon-derived protein PEG10 [Smittium culicis]|uniref:Retrotransposon-derived protein PEG10 n=1 Tax=Smittium culicis TaxID=133412 RepID=A0A1R1X7S7_9FUNG|nr:Retrotransposon-derived protein PEG10 [Smittium culicis]
MMISSELQVLRKENSRLQALQAATQDPPVPFIVPAQVSTQFPAHVPAARIALPERYDGDRSQFRGFTNQCRLLFFTHPDHYPSQTNKVGLVMSLLTGNALRWASPYIEKGSPVLQDYELFMKEFSKVFDDPQRTQTANEAIRALRQGFTTVSMYASEFRRLMMDLDWNESALVSQFSEGLNENILDTLALFQTPSDLEGYINAAITVDTRITRRKEEKARRRRGVQPPLSTTSQITEPMQIDSVHRTVSQPERDRRMKLGLFFYCGGSGPERKQSLNLQDASTVSMKSEPMSKSAPKQISKPIYNQKNRFMIPVTIHTPCNHSFKIMAMIYSGASGIFINKKIVDAKCIRTQAKKDPISVEFIDGSPLTEGPITHHTKPLKIQIQDNHWELAVFDVMTCYHADMILGLPCQKKDPKVRSAKHLKKQKKYTPGPIVGPPPGQQAYQLMGLPIVNISQETENHRKETQIQENQSRDKNSHRHVSLRHSQEHHSQEHHSQEHHSQENHSKEHHSQEHHIQEHHSKETQAIDELEPHQEDILNDFHFEHTDTFGLESIIDSNYFSDT